MEFTHQYFWALLLLAIILVSLMIVMIFIIINVCISKRAARYSTQAKPNHYGDRNVKHENEQVHHKELEIEKPPLPSRDQFKSMESAQRPGRPHPSTAAVQCEHESAVRPRQPWARVVAHKLSGAPCCTSSTRLPSRSHQNGQHNSGRGL